LTVLDSAVLAAYSQAYATWRTAEEVLAKLTEGDQRQRALARISRDAARSMVRYGVEFGLTPAARSRLAAVCGRPPGKFGGLIG
jgi:P27 family predicted phage terminase small subunit